MAVRRREEATQYDRLMVPDILSDHHVRHASSAKFGADDISTPSGSRLPARRDGRKILSNHGYEKQTAIIKFLTKEGCTAADIYKRLRNVYSEATIDVSMQRWIKKFKEDKTASWKVIDKNQNRVDN